MKYYFIIAEVIIGVPCKMFGAFTETEWNDLKASVQTYFESNNEAIVYMEDYFKVIPSYESWLEPIEEREITQIEYDKLKSLFNLTDNITCWGNNYSYISESFLS